MKTGFTLIELIIVMAIVGLLASIAIPTYLGVKESNKLLSLGLKKGNDGLIYNPDTKEIVEVNSDKTRVTRIIGKISTPILVFENLRTSEARKSVIEYYASKPPQDIINIPSNVSEIVIIDGVKYVRESK